MIPRDTKEKEMLLYNSSVSYAGSKVDSTPDSTVRL